jgi:Uma2 family endonuclease
MIAYRPDGLPATETLADLLGRLGGIRPSRVRLRPPPGTATFRDLLAERRRGKSFCELTERTLVDKPLGSPESLVGASLYGPLGSYIRGNWIGQVAACPTVRLAPDVVRIPDACFLSWERVPRGRARRGIPTLAPDLVIEVPRPSNTPGEIRRKLGEYSAAGTRMAWIIDHRERTVRVHEGPDRAVLLRDGDAHDGGDVLPGFRLDLTGWFGEALRD